MTPRRCKSLVLAFFSRFSHLIDGFASIGWISAKRRNRIQTSDFNYYTELHMMRKKRGRLWKLEATVFAHIFFPVALSISICPMLELHAKQMSPTVMPNRDDSVSKEIHRLRAHHYIHTPTNTD